MQARSIAGDEIWKYVIGFFYIRFAILEPCKDAFVTRLVNLAIHGTADRHLVLYMMIRFHG